MAINVNAQVECGTIMEDDSIEMTVDQNVTLESFQSAEPYVLKVHFWDINMIDGTNPHPLSEVTALNAVAQLNKNYNGFNIFFKYDGIDEFDSEYYDTNLDQDAGQQSFTIANDMYTNAYFLQGAVNIYSINDLRASTGSGDGIHGVPAAGIRIGGNHLFQMILMRYDYIEPTNNNASVLTHEVGHFFNLAHTFDCFVSAIGEVFCENVTRDINDTCFNADVRGDKIIDTYATPYPMEYDTDDCSYIDNGEVDSCGVPYNYGGLSPQVNNFMGYAGTCKSEFTAGQIAWIRARILLILSLTDIHVIETYPISILYEPYKGEYYLAGPSTSHNPPLFQYGFTYEMVDCSQAEVFNQPSDYDFPFWYGAVVENYTIDYNVPIEHKNHTALRILELNNEVTDVQPQKCYNNFNKAPSGGTIIKFLDGVPNTNVTITQQDSLQINNNTLIENLDPGLYNIKKNFEDGTTQETMILKENN